MKGVHWVLALLALFGQDESVKTTTPTTPEVVRVLAIQARTVEGAPRYLDASLEVVRELLEKVPGNQFTEMGFFELEAHYGRDAVADLGGGYTLSFQPSELTELDEILFECHIDLTEGGRTVEALRVTGKAARGQGAVFRGLTLPEGELVVVMSLAQAEDESGRGGSGGSGQEQGGAGDGGASAPGEDGAGDGETNAPEEEPSTVPELQSRQLQIEAEPSEDSPEGGQTVAAGDGGVPPDRVTVEGILRALEEQDMAEQKSARGRRFDVVMKGDWW
jgi:hypothetical protein